MTSAGNRLALAYILSYTNIPHLDAFATSYFGQAQANSGLRKKASLSQYESHSHHQLASNGSIPPDQSNQTSRPLHSSALKYTLTVLCTASAPHGRYNDDLELSTKRACTLLCYWCQIQGETFDVDTRRRVVHKSVCIDTSWRGNTLHILFFLL